MTTSSQPLKHDLTVMLAEAGQRSSPEEAAIVIAGTLRALEGQYPEVRDLARLWSSKLPTPSPPPVRVGLQGHGDDSRH